MIVKCDMGENKMEIRLCEENDIAEVGAFYDKVVLHLCETINYPKWEYKKYPSENSVREKTALRQQFVCVGDEGILGAFVLNDDPQGKYENAGWSKTIPQGGYMVCHTLATAPDAQGRGIGRAMVEYCIRHAAQKGYRAIRLDVVPDNLPARKLYEKCGFQYVGDVDLERGIEMIPVFSMYELVL